MVLAQTTDDTEEAAAAARKGLQLIRQAKRALLSREHGEVDRKHNNDEEEDEEDEDPLVEVNRVLAHALCSLSELLLTHAIAAGVGSNPDAVLADEIIDECKAALKEAADLAPDDPDPLQALCNLLRLQGKREEALEALRKSMAFWYTEIEDDKEEEEEGEEGEEDDKGKGSVDACKHDDVMEDDEDEDDEDDTMPSYEHRIVTAHLLVELDDDMEKAIDLLLQLLEENDGDVEGWRLLAIAGREAGENEMAAHAAKQVLDLAAEYEMPAEEPLCAEMKELKEAMEKLMMQG